MHSFISEDTDKQVLDIKYENKVLVSILFDQFKIRSNFATNPRGVRCFIAYIF